MYKEFFVKEKMLFKYTYIVVPPLDIPQYKV